MHAEALGGGVAQFDAAVEGGVCPFLNGLGKTALGEMRSVYEQVEAGNFDALGELAERLATAVEQKATEDSSAAADPTTTPVEVLAKSKPEPAEEVTVEAKIEDVLVARVSETPGVVPPIGLVTKEKAEPVVAEALFGAAERVAPVIQAETFIKPTVKEKPLVFGITEVVQAKVEPVVLPPAVVAEIVAHDRVEAAEVLPVILGDEALVEVRAVVANVSVPEQAEERDFRVEELFMLAGQPAADRPANTVDTSPFPEALTYSDEELLVVYDAEVVETYRELETLMAEAEEVPTVLQTADFDAMEVSATDEIVVPDYPPTDLAPIEPLARPSFRTYVAEQSAPPEPITFQAVQEHTAEEQPLEQVLAEVAVLLSDRVAPERSGHEEHEAISSALQEIADMLPTCYIVNETGEPQVRITPEMTKNLLNLLQNLGYDQPRQVLVEFVKDNGLVYLFEAMDYLSSLTRDEKYNPEFASYVPTLWSASDDEHPKVRLSRALFGLIAPRERIPV